MNKYVERLYNGLWKENPTFVQMLGMCPTLAVTTSAINGIGMGLSTTVVLVLSNVMISMLRKIIPDKVRVPAFIVVVASFVTIVQLLMQGFLPSLYDSLGIYIPLIVVNCIILGRAEAYASKNPVGLSLFDGLGMGLGFTFGLTCIGIVREILGSGQIFGFQLLPLYDSATGGFGFTPIVMFILAPGAFLVLAMLVALINWIKMKSAAKNGLDPNDVVVCEMNCAACSAACGGQLVFDGLVRDVTQVEEKKKPVPKAKPAPKTEEAPAVKETPKAEEVPAASEEAKTEEAPEAEETPKMEEAPKAEETTKGGDEA